ncbi:hypothetical protein QCE62_25150 [Caballeronia sp. LZ033]|nr:hypothetical protein [Caballeronia sp. LZ033]
MSPQPFCEVPANATIDNIDPAMRIETVIVTARFMTATVEEVEARRRSFIGAIPSDLEALNETSGRFKA